MLHRGQIVQRIHIEAVISCISDLNILFGVDVVINISDFDVRAVYLLFHIIS